MSKPSFVTAIVAMNQDRVIGKDGDLPWHYSEDLKRFKRKTLDSTIIMGRKTWESIGSKPLPKRRNIVISRSDINDVECYTSIEMALQNCNGNIWIIGGGQIYQASLHLCDAVDVTWVPESVSGDHLVKFAALDPVIWQAGEMKSNPVDARLSHQLFIRKQPCT